MTRFYVERNHSLHNTIIFYHVMEEGPGAPKWDDETPRPALTVKVYPPETRYGALASAEVSWPATSDKRPDLAAALAIALESAAQEARSLNEAAGLEVAP